MLWALWTIGTIQSVHTTDLGLNLFYQFTAKSLQRQAKKATKDEGLEKAKLKKVSIAVFAIQGSSN